MKTFGLNAALAALVIAALFPAAALAGGFNARASLVPFPAAAVIAVHAPARYWVPGYWAWDGYRNIWVEGHWVVERRENYYPPRYREERHHREYHHWHR